MSKRVKGWSASGGSLCGGLYVTSGSPWSGAIEPSSVGVKRTKRSAVCVSSIGTLIWIALFARSMFGKISGCSSNSGFQYVWIFISP